MEETATSSFAHAESPNQIPPEITSQNTANATKQVKIADIVSTSPKLSENTRHQSPPSKTLPEDPSWAHEKVNRQPVTSILRPPRQKFPEDPSPVREAVAPLGDIEKKGIPPNARWTKIDRRLVNPEALEIAHERYEERQDYVIVLRVLTKETIEKYALKTREIRATRGIPTESSSVT